MMKYRSYLPSLVTVAIIAPGICRGQFVEQGAAKVQSPPLRLYGDVLFKNDAFATWQLAWRGRFANIATTVAVTGLHVFDMEGVTNTEGNHIFGDTSFFSGSIQFKTTVRKIDWMSGQVNLNS